MYGVVGMVENRKRICLFDTSNHCILCPGSGSVHAAQMNDIVSCEYKALEIFIRSESRIIGCNFGSGRR